MLAVTAVASALAFAPGQQAVGRLPGQAAQRSLHAPTMLLDGATQWLADAAILLPDAAASAADTAASAAAAAAEQQPGWFDLVLVKPFEAAIVMLHSGLQSVGVEQAYGPSIILFTCTLKALTFPLNKQQIESTTKMQAIAPAAKKLQDKYRNADPARLNQELQKLYQENQVNPLAGCLPSLAQIPIFIGLYRSVLNLAKEDKLTESFLWLPSLEGPVSDYTQGIGWLTGNAEKGLAWSGVNPPLGWHDTAAYLVLPVLLVISQYISTAILTPKTDDPAQQQSQAILKFLPLMIGWFSLNVPSGLGLYWMTNNVLTTATTVLIRRNVNMEVAGVGGGMDMPIVVDDEPKAQGFGRRYGEVIETTGGDGTKVTIKPPGSKRADRRKAADADQPIEAAATVIDAPAVAVAESAVVAGAAEGRPTKKKKSSKKKKK